MSYFLNYNTTDRHKAMRSRIYRMMQLICFLFFIFNVCNAAVETIQQGITISGIVIDAEGQPLPGVSVTIKGTTQGTATDTDGAYSLPVQDANVSLVFSYIGFITQEMAIGNQRSINITLIEDTRQMEEVVVVGYGIQRKMDVTGAIATINETAMRNILASSIDQKMIGQTAGVQVQQLTGAPGGGTSVKIRGNGSLGAGNEPLYVVDGMPYSSGKDQNTNPMIFINPNDIESVTILKDASSTAIYGSRGANGVIIITTKSGLKNKTQVQYSTNIGFQQVPEKGRPKMLNQRQFAELQRDRIDLAVRRQENREPTLEDYPEAYRDLQSLTGQGTNWYDLILRTALVQEHNLNLSKGADDSRMFFSLGYRNQEGVIHHSGVDRYSGKLNIENQIGKFLINASLQPVFINQKRVDTNSGRGDVMGLAIWGNPVVTPYDTDGNLTPYLQSPQSRYHTAWGFANPLYALQNTTRDYQVFQHIGSAFIEWEIIKNLKIKTSFNTVLSTSKYYQYIPGTVGGANTPPSKLGQSVNQRSNGFNWVSETTLNYQKQIRNHAFNVLLGYSTQMNTNRMINATAAPFANDLIRTINAAQGITNWGESVNKWSMISYIGRVNYSFLDKYLFTATIRSDGSSRFGKNNRFAFFPSFAGGWRISEEDFLKNNPVISNLKLRTSYGKSGNNNIGNYAHLPEVSSNTYIIDNKQVTASFIGVSNPHLGWEESEQIDLGLDINLFKNRLSFVIDMYNRKSRNMLLNDLIPRITGYGSQLTNKGNVRNRGVELDVSGLAVTGALDWDIGFSISFNRNRVLSTNSNNDRILSGDVDGRSSHITEVGKPVGQFFGFILDGLYTADDLTNPAVAKYATAYEGAGKYRDLNGDGLITEILDYTAIGNPHPDFIYSFRNNFYYRGFDLYILVNGQYGGKVVNGLRMTTDNLQGFFNVGQEWANRWRSRELPGDGKHAGVVPQTPSLGHRLNTLWIEDASYLRISNVSLGYSLPASMMNRQSFLKSIKGVKVSIGIQNLLTLTNYSGANPEAQQSGIDNTLSPGYDMTSYPLSRTVSFGLQITF